MGLEDHPGYLGFTSQGVIAIHADWPVYPIEHGWHMALIMLGSFPEGTKFMQNGQKRADLCAAATRLGAVSGIQAALVSPGTRSLARPSRSELYDRLTLIARNSLVPRGRLEAELSGGTGGTARG